MAKHSIKNFLEICNLSATGNTQLCGRIFEPVNQHVCNTEETFLQNYQKILKNCFLSTTRIVMLSTGSNLRPHTGMLPVMQGLQQLNPYNYTPLSTIIQCKQKVNSLTLYVAVTQFTYGNTLPMVNCVTAT